MRAMRKTAIWVGALFIATTFTYSIGDGILQELFLSPNFPLGVSDRTTAIVIAVLLQLLCGLGVVGIAVLMYPIFNTENIKIAIWYVGIRSIKCAIIAINGVHMLTLSAIGKSQIENVDTLTTLGAMIIADYHGSFIFLALVLAFGALAFYYGLFKMALVPKFIPIWGIIAVVLMGIGLVMEALGYSRNIGFYLPMGLNELFLSFWLLVKGFASSEILTENNQNR
ncbi:DUF4386 domain-containing protein [Spongiimicrobium salis]|uniref:DUF4386 domain-containing protein n=1 Tax=Spongiimicrobium salis TaxID=1667022 RepID=UPI00374CDCAD